MCVTILQQLFSNNMVLYGSNLVINQFIISSFQTQIKVKYQIELNQLRSTNILALRMKDGTFSN